MPGCTASPPSSTRPTTAFAPQLLLLTCHAINASSPLLLLYSLARVTAARTSTPATSLLPHLLVLRSPQLYRAAGPSAAVLAKVLPCAASLPSVRV
jgi:hypothetical protein